MQAIVARERLKSLMLAGVDSGRHFLHGVAGYTAGLFKPDGDQHASRTRRLPAAWIQGHGHAQVFGWIGSFILGIGFYSQPSHGRSVVRIPLTCFVLWTSGVAMRWTASIYGWHWRLVFPISAGFELIAVLLFIAAASQHKLPERAQSKRAKPRMELWMVSVLMGTAGLAALVIFNFVECVRLAVNGTLLAFPHALDQKYLVLLAWGFLVPVVWGFSARWLPTFLAIARPSAPVFLHRFDPGPDWCAFRRGRLDRRGDDFACLKCGRNRVRIASDAASSRSCKGPGNSSQLSVVHSACLRMAGDCRLNECLGRHCRPTRGHLGRFSPRSYCRIRRHNGLCYRPAHPAAFCRHLLASSASALMFISLLLLQTGCTLRVCSEPLAYEGIQSFAWKTLPVSGMLELSGVLVFAVNIALTFLLGRSAFARTPMHEMSLVTCVLPTDHRHNLQASSENEPKVSLPVTNVPALRSHPTYDRK